MSDALIARATARQEALREALGAPAALAWLAERLAEERRQATWQPGIGFEVMAWHAGRVAVLDELVQSLQRLRES
jgi:hypothetical protein